MKKFLFSAAVVMSTVGICVANFNNTGSKLPLNNHTYIVKDTMPSDTSMRKDSSLLLIK